MRWCIAKRHLTSRIYHEYTTSHMTASIALILFDMDDVLSHYDRAARIHRGDRRKPFITSFSSIVYI